MKYNRKNTEDNIPKQWIRPSNLKGKVILKIEFRLGYKISSMATWKLKVKATMEEQTNNIE